MPPSRRARLVQVEDEDLETQAIPAEIHRERATEKNLVGLRLLVFWPT